MDAGKIMRDDSLTCAIPEHFRDKFLMIKLYTNLRLLSSSSSFLAPLGVGSAIHRHQPPQSMVLGQVDCFVQCEVVGSQISLDGVQPRDAGMLWWGSC